MEVVNPCCAGLDVHKKTVVACALRTQEDGTVKKQVRTFGTMTGSLLGLGDWLDELGVTAVAMESTGIFWRPVFNLLEDDQRTITLVNAQQHPLCGYPGVARQKDRREGQRVAG